MRAFVEKGGVVISPCIHTSGLSCGLMRLTICHIVNSFVFLKKEKKKRRRTGTLYLVDKGETLITCLAYIDLNPLRTGIVKRSADYRWNSIGYHIQTNNRDGFLSTDFGLKQFNVKSTKERIRRNLFPGPTSDSNMCLIPKMKKSRPR